MKSRAGAQLLAAFLGVIIFIDDYFNALAVGQVARPKLQIDIKYQELQIDIKYQELSLPILLTQHLLQFVSSHQFRVGAPLLLESLLLY